MAIARTLVQKELARSVYIVLKEEVDFNHTFKGQPLSKRKASKWPRLYRFRFPGQVGGLIMPPSG